MISSPIIFKEEGPKIILKEESSQITFKEEGSRLILKDENSQIIFKDEKSLKNQPGLSRARSIYILDHVLLPTLKQVRRDRARSRNAPSPDDSDMDLDPNDIVPDAPNTHGPNQREEVVQVPIDAEPQNQDNRASSFSRFCQYENTLTAT